MKNIPKPDDTADAMAICICHINSRKINDLIKQIDTTKIDKTPVKYSIISETKNVNGKTGFLVTRDYAEISKKIKYLLKNEKVLKQISVPSVFYRPE